MLRDAAIAIQVCVGAIGQHLREPSVQIKRVVRRHAVDGLLYAIPESIIGEDIVIRALRDVRQAVGGIVGIRARAIIEQVAVGVPLIGRRAHADEPVGGVVGVLRAMGERVSTLTKWLSKSWVWVRVCVLASGGVGLDASGMPDIHP